MSAKKKMKESVTYKKGTELTDNKQLKDIVDRAQTVFAKQQTVYDDGSQSLTVEIHFKPKDKDTL